jgi:hypothetical protein
VQLLAAGESGFAFRVDGFAPGELAPLDYQAGADAVRPNGPGACDVEFEAASLVAAMGTGLCALTGREARRLHVLLRKEAVGAAPWLAPQLQPRCVPLGYCDLPGNADGHCRVRPHLARLAASDCTAPSISVASPADSPAPASTAPAWPGGPGGAPEAAPP